MTKISDLHLLTYDYSLRNRIGHRLRLEIYCLLIGGLKCVLD